MKIKTWTIILNTYPIKENNTHQSKTRAEVKFLLKKLSTQEETDLQQSI